MIERLQNFVISAARICVGVSFAVLIMAVVIQVVGRMTGLSPVWTEELTRYALLYMIAFGAGLALHTGDLVNVDVVCDALPDALSKSLRVLAALATFALAAYLLPHAWRYVSIGKLQTSPALGVRMDFIHLTVWLTLFGLAVFAVLRIVQMVVLKQSGRHHQAQPEE